MSRSIPVAMYSTSLSDILTKLLEEVVKPKSHYRIQQGKTPKLSSPSPKSKSQMEEKEKRKEEKGQGTWGDSIILWATTHPAGLG